MLKWKSIKLVLRVLKTLQKLNLLMKITSAVCLQASLKINKHMLMPSLKTQLVGQTILRNDHIFFIRYICMFKWRMQYWKLRSKSLICVEQNIWIFQWMKVLKLIKIFWVTLCCLGPQEQNKRKTLILKRFFLKTSMELLKK